MSLSKRLLNRTPFAVYGFRGAVARAQFALDGELVRYVARTASYWEFRAVRSARVVQVYLDGEVWQTLQPEPARSSRASIAAHRGANHTIAWSMAKQFRRAIRSRHTT